MDSEPIEDFFTNTDYLSQDFSFADYLRNVDGPTIPFNDTKPFTTDLNSLSFHDIKSLIDKQLVRLPPFPKTLSYTDFECDLNFEEFLGHTDPFYIVHLSDLNKS